jgi:hypothetical protein
MCFSKVAKVATIKMATIKMAIKMATIKRRVCVIMAICFLLWSVTTWLSQFVQVHKKFGDFTSFSSS